MDCIMIIPIKWIRWYYDILMISRVQGEGIKQVKAGMDGTWPARDQTTIIVYCCDVEESVFGRKKSTLSFAFYIGMILVCMCMNREHIMWFVWVIFFRSRGCFNLLITSCNRLITFKWKNHNICLYLFSSN